jgi:crossover junction endodeoxyribonuclease RusA
MSAWAAVKQAKPAPFTRFHMTFCPPTNRARDLDNLIASMKPALDGMAAALGVNDSTFRFTAEIGEIVPGGRVIVEASE